jgi:NAD(P)-dependent dehydrogenase (short-subunit alcohol dehydrogenase family)
MAKTILITGASSGFGKDAALLFKNKGWNVAATMRSPAKEESWSRPAGLFTPQLDVTDRASMQKAVDIIVAEFGGIDVLLNNAGFALMGPLEGTSPEDLRRQFDTNVLGLIEMTQVVLPVMRNAGTGLIINVSSILGRSTMPLLVAYNSTKFAIEGLTEALQYELSVHGIRVKLIEPGPSLTNFSGSSMTKISHPAYERLVKGFDKLTDRMVKHLPGPEKVAQTIYRAAMDESPRLRYPVLAFPYLHTRSIIGARCWSALMKFVARYAEKHGD